MSIERRPALSDEVARHIRLDVTEGRLQPRDKLPSEQEMCKSFGVSRAVIREAISRLKYEGLLESQQGKGVFVSPDAQGKTFRLDFQNFQSGKELAHVLELLVPLEVGATELAAQRRSAAELKLLQHWLEAMEQAIAEGKSGATEDFEFHNTIVKATRNPYYAELMAFVDNRVRRFIRAARANTARFEGLAHAVQEEHRAIFNAIRDKDAAAARQAAERHLRNAATRLQLYNE